MRKRLTNIIQTVSYLALCGLAFVAMFFVGQGKYTVSGGYSFSAPDAYADVPGSSGTDETGSSGCGGCGESNSSGDGCSATGGSCGGSGY